MLVLSHFINSLRVENKNILSAVIMGFLTFAVKYVSLALQKLRCSVILCTDPYVQQHFVILTYSKMYNKASQHPYMYEKKNYSLSLSLSLPFTLFACQFKTVQAVCAFYSVHYFSYSA